MFSWGLDFDFFGNILLALLYGFLASHQHVLWSVLFLIMSKYYLQAGFTMIELMVVVVILGILVAIGSTQLSSATTRARDAATKTNMHAFQTVVEVYAVNYDGTYPDSVAQLTAESTAKADKTLGSLRNSHGYGAGLHKSYTDESALTKLPGVVSLSPDNIGYTLYGYDKNRNKLGSKGTIYVLSNH